MGIKGLFPFLQSHAPGALMQLFTRPGQSAAVDGTGILTRLMFSATRHVASETNFMTHSIQRDAVYVKTERLLQHWLEELFNRGLAVVFVVDGSTPTPAKASCLAGRNALRRATRERYEQLLADYRAGEPVPQKDIISLAARVDVLSKTDLVMIADKVLRTHGLGVTVAPGEGEKLCAMMAKEKRVDYVWSADSDACVFLPPMVIRDAYNGVCTAVSCPKILQELGLSAESFRDFCILCGCDFNDNIPGIGPIKAYALIKTYGRIEAIPDNAFFNKSKRYAGKDCLKYDVCRALFADEPSTVPG